MFNDWESIPGCDHAHHHHLQIFVWHLFGILAGIVDIGGEVNSLSKVASIGRSHHTEALLTNLPNGILRSALEHGQDGRESWICIEEEPILFLDQDIQEFLSKCGISLNFPILLAEEARVDPVPPIEGITISLKRIKQFFVVDCKDLDRRCRVESDLGCKLVELIKHLFIVDPFPILHKKGEIAS